MILLPPTIPALAADFACSRPDYRVSFQKGQPGGPFHSHLIRFQNNTSTQPEWAVASKEKSGKNDQIGNDNISRRLAETGVACAVVMDGNIWCRVFHAGSSPTLPYVVVLTAPPDKGLIACALQECLHHHPEQSLPLLFCWREA